MFFRKKKFVNPWEGRMEPFRIIGNVFFCGTYDASCHLIDTGDGLILIDSGYSDTLYLVVDSIHRLGFDPRDIRYIVNTHWHGDHTEATAALAGLSGAKTLIGRGDAQKAARYFTPDILLADGDVLALGNTSIRFLETPGHTRGTVSPFFEVEDGGKVYRLGMFGGAGVNTMERAKFDYEGCREDYRASVRRLMNERVDVFIGNHVWNNQTEDRGRVLRETGENTFIDGELWGKFLEWCEMRLDQVIAADP